MWQWPLSYCIFENDSYGNQSVYTFTSIIRKIKNQKELQIKACRLLESKCLPPQVHEKNTFPIDFLPYWWTSTTSHIISIPFVSKSSRWVPYPWSLTVSKITYSKVNTRLSLYLYIDDGVVLSYWIAINWSQYKVSKEVKIHRTPDCGVPSPS